MFGRTSLDNDAVATARRRLAAVAAQFDSANSGGAATGGEDRAAPAASAGVGTTPPERSDLLGRPGSARVGITREAGRHRDDSYRNPLGRWRLTALHVTLAAVVVAALIAVAAWWALRSVPEPQTVTVANERSLPAAAAAQPSPGATSASTPSGVAPDSNQGTVSSQLVVDVTGKVRHPGIVELAPGSRVVDALHAAGGARPGADTTALNLARQLVDGEQIVVGLDVPTVGPAPSTPATGSADQGETIAPVDVNTADQAQLETLPGIGPVTAVSILDWRNQNGSFSSVDELLEVSGIGDATLADIEPYVYV
jgi:competence protein ComEA